MVKMIEILEKATADTLDVVRYYKEAYDIHMTGCPQYINDECDGCGVCERTIPEDIQEWI